MSSGAYADLLDALSVVRITSWITPLDLPQVRVDLAQALAEGKASVAPWKYAPFDFASAKERLLDAVGRSSTWTSANSTLDQNLFARLHDGLQAVIEIGQRDDARFTAWSLSRYGAPTESTLRYAARIVAEGSGRSPTRPDESSDTRTAEGAAHLLQAALYNSGLRDWRVVIRSSMAARMSVLTSRRTVNVDGSATFAASELRRLLVHEVGTHAVRAANAWAQPLSVARIALGDAVPTEEGLALWHEADFGVAQPVNQLQYAARVIAIRSAATLGVVAVARELVPILGLDAAVATAIRVKRGLTDPNAPGGFTKDHGYLTGFLRVSEHLRQHPDDHGLLMSTKWPLEMLPVARQLRAHGALRDGALLPDPEGLGLPAV